MRTLMTRLLADRNANINQDYKPDITGTKASPHVVEVPVPTSLDFKLPEIEILKRSPTGTWKKAIHGEDYDYGYPANDLLRIEFYVAAEFKINI